MKPNIVVPSGPIDLENPHPHVARIRIGSDQIINGSITAEKTGTDFGFTQDFDGGVIGITDWSFGTWTEKSLDGGTV